MSAGLEMALGIGVTLAFVVAIVAIVRISRAQAAKQIFDPAIRRASQGGFAIGLGAGIFAASHAPAGWSTWAGSVAMACVIAGLWMFRGVAPDEEG